MNAADMPALSTDLEWEQKQLVRHIELIKKLVKEHKIAKQPGAARLLDELDELREHLGMMLAIKATVGEANGPAAAGQPAMGCPDDVIEDRALFDDVGHLIDQCDSDLKRHRWPESWRLAELTFENLCQRWETYQAHAARNDGVTNQEGFGAEGGLLPHPIDRWPA